MPQEPQKVFGDRYEIVKHIARGGMAQVYLARDLLLDRQVALKVLFPELSIDQSFVERFRREARAAANLSHPNIVSVYDWGQGDHTYFIVMEYVDGPTLSALLRQGPLAPARAATIAASVAAALDFAHRRGVIHRDVKPGNVLIDTGGQVKVADFGIARAAGASEDLTQTGSVMGTATYFSPEQAQGYPVDARSDVYSLGVVLYEMLTGKPPFTGDNPVSIAYKHVKEEPTRPTQMVRSIPAPLESIVLKAMSKDAARRYQSADEMRLDLLRFANGQGVTASATATTVIGAVGAGGDPTRVQRAASHTTVLPAGAYGDPGIGPGSSRRRNAIIAFLVVLLLIAAAAVYLGGKSAGWFGTSAKTLTVPSNLAGEPLATAQGRLSAAGFTNVHPSYKASKSVKSGDVISSNPKGGASAKSNALLTLYVSSGAVQVAVPSVAGLSQDAATQALQAQGFTVTPTQATSNTVAQGNVISTNPAGGAKAPQGSTVTITVSSGKKQVTIPSLTGKSGTSAGAELSHLGLNVLGQNESSPTVPAGEVTRTDPPAGSTVAVGSNVTVYTSTGPASTTVPNLTNLTQSQAQAALTQANLTGNYTQVPVNDPSQNGIVQTWSPNTGATVQSGSTVQVTIGQYSPTGSTTTTTTTTTSSGGGGSGNGSGGLLGGGSGNG